MSISSATSRNDYTGNGATSVYSYNFRIFAQTDLLVTKRLISTGVETVLALTTDYTVSGVGDAAGGSVTLVAGALASTYELTIRRVRPLTQTTDIRNQGSFLPETHEDAFDHQVMLAQQLEDEISRSLTLPETFSSSEINTELPAPVATRVIGWNSTATGLANYAAVGSAAVSGFIETLLDDASATVARTTLDAQQEIHSLTQDTDPAANDFLLTRDVSASADKKVLVSDILKVSTIQSKTTTYQVLITDDVILADASAGSFTVTLPAVATSTGKRFRIINLTNDLSKLVTISPNLKGASRALNTRYEAIEVMSDGSIYHVLTHDCDTDWDSYVPAITQLGTVSGISFFSRRIGDSYQVMGKFTTGPSGLGATEVRIPFRANITSDSTKLPATTQTCGIFESANGGANNYVLLVEPSVTYFTYARGNLTKAVGTAINVSEEEHIFGTVPIANWWA